MRLPMLDRTGRRPLILGKGGFGRQLADWLRDDGWDEPLFLDDNAPGCAGKLRDYADPALLKPGRAAFVALGNNELRVNCCKSWRRPATRRPPTAAAWRPSAPAPCWNPAASCCRRPTWAPAHAWAQAASSTPGPSSTTTPCWAAACMWRGRHRQGRGAGRALHQSRFRRGRPLPVGAGLTLPNSGAGTGHPRLFATGKGERIWTDRKRSRRGGTISTSSKGWASCWFVFGHYMEQYRLGSI